MAKIISQETFDDVVKENIVEFSMDCEEAKQETIKQFEAQGINLANIIKDLTIDDESGRPILNITIERLKQIAEDESKIESSECQKALDTLSGELEKSVPHRVMAANLGASEIIAKVLKAVLSKHDNVNEEPIFKSGFTAWNALVNKNPDVFNDESLYIILRIFEKSPNDELILLALQKLKNVTLMHEINRQNIVNADILMHLKPLLERNSTEVLKETCAVFRSLILDDDVRVEFSKAHEHARAIAAEVLITLTKLLEANMKNKNTFSELCLTIAALTVRHEFCVQVEEAGGLEFIFNGMREHSSSIRVAKESLKLIRALAGNDGVKKNILKNSRAKLIDDVINIHKSNEIFARTALICLSTLTLRSKENSEAFFEAGAPETIMETMKLHNTSKIVQRNGAWAIRNMVSRTREQCPTFLSHGAEDILKNAMVEFPDVQYDFKSALRDLGCHVELKEEWTGVKNKIHIQNEA